MQSSFEMTLPVLNKLVIKFGIRGDAPNSIRSFTFSLEQDMKLSITEMEGDYCSRIYNVLFTCGWFSLMCLVSWDIERC